MRYQVRPAHTQKKQRQVLGQSPVVLYQFQIIAPAIKFKTSQRKGSPEQCSFKDISLISKIQRVMQADIGVEEELGRSSSRMMTTMHLMMMRRSPSIPKYKKRKPKLLVASKARRKLPRVTKNRSSNTYLVAINYLSR